MRRLLEPRAPDGRWQVVPVPKGQLFLYKQHGRKGSLSPHDPPASPISGHFSGSP